MFPVRGARYRYIHNVSCTWCTISIHSQCFLYVVHDIDTFTMFPYVVHDINTFTMFPVRDARYRYIHNVSCTWCTISIHSQCFVCVMHDINTFNIIEILKVCRVFQIL
ncbi:hypothetical protein EGW08_013879 [Elysia chlorotica]|uniref:Uncharacterized protein n=1 Tax=Elysia chlorotica TaxID=188477 RepID=A0A3S1HFJ6_ELYCH|nr:hypothetical protein EGW08_013879 [Elysia chlorotica]